jgi:hypothetical protein
MHGFLASALAAAFAAAALPAVATTPQWAALIALDDGGLDPQMIPVVADSETDCVAALSSYRDAVVIEPCQPVPTASAITDDNDHDRRRTGTRPPRNDGGGAGAGAGAGLGGLGHVGGG